MKKPSILGIVNITEDSFSDGGRFLETKSAIDHAIDLIRKGGDIIDLGAASSNPASAEVPPNTEIARLAPVIHELRREKIPVSVDTFHPEVQLFCIEEQVDYINDIQGFPHKEIYPALAQSQCKLIIMHSIHRFGKAVVEDTDPRLIVDMIFDFFDERTNTLISAGIEPDRLVLDPGMGFFLGSRPESSMETLRAIPDLKNRYNLPVLISVSRKSFLGAITDRPVPERGNATLAAEIYAVNRGADYIRTHDTGALRDALLVLQSLENRNSGSFL